MREGDSDSEIITEGTLFLVKIEFDKGRALAILIWKCACFDAG